jgi:hypothetical protein
LLEFTGSGRDQASAVQQLVCQQSVLLSAKKVVEVRGTGVRVRMHNCALLAANDIFDIDPGSAAGPRLNMQLLLEHNTFAARQNVITVRDAHQIIVPLEPIVVQADANYFADPFTETPRTSCLLHAAGEALRRGLFLWQGKDNAYDEKRGLTFATIDDKATPRPYTTWQQLWGKAGETQPLLVEWPPTPTMTFSVSAPQLERLALPKQLQAAAGADLAKLPKKK